MISWYIFVAVLLRQCHCPLAYAPKMLTVFVIKDKGKIQLQQVKSVKMTMNSIMQVNYLV